MDWDGDSPILLHGAPDEAIGRPGGETEALQVMQLDMSNDVLEELLSSARSGKQPQITFGRNPVRVSSWHRFLFHGSVC
jgi:RNA polymerase II elongation factor ELL